MKILILNSGSSSVKFQLIDMTGEVVLGKGVVEKIGSSDAIITYRPEKKNKLREIREVLNHEEAIEIVLSMLLHPQHGVIKDKSEIDGIGHRVVHGGEDFSESVFITEKVKSTIRKCIQFAPLHNPHNLKGIEACEHLLSGIPQVAVFDTAFHHTIKAAEALSRPLEELKLITCHLGNGASVAAVDGGKSVDTTMGFTPLEGLIMGTRCGDIDPALVPYIMEKERLDTKEIDSIMNKNSGMLGLTETSNDMREIEAEAFRGNEQHILALDIYCHKLKRYIGAFMAVLGGVDAIVFAGGVGEKSFYVREMVLCDMKRFGIAIDKKKNDKNAPDISAGEVKILVIPTNEELAIARDAQDILQAMKENAGLPIPDEIISSELALLSEDDKAELVLLWAADPKMSVAQLTKKLIRKIKKDIKTQTVKRELEILGLNRVSESKKKHLAKS